MATFSIYWELSCSFSFELFLLVMSSWSVFCCSQYTFESIPTDHVCRCLRYRLVLSFFFFLSFYSTLPNYKKYFPCPYDTSSTYCFGFTSRLSYLSPFLPKWQFTSNHEYLTCSFLLILATFDSAHFKRLWI